MRASSITLAFNAMPWLPYTLACLYPVMDEIVIVEGALPSAAPFATSNGHSTDGTLAAIAAFPDPAGKIKLVQQHGFWPDKNAMAAAAAAHITGDWLWQFDSDEMMHPADVRRVQVLLAEHPHIGAVTLKMLNFYDGFDAIILGGRYHHHRYNLYRAWRWQPGARYTHLPAMVSTPSGYNLRHAPTLSGDVLAQDYGIYFYHYGHLSGAQVAQKMAIYAPLDYAQRYMGRDADYIARWPTQHFARFTPWRVDRHPRPLSWLVRFRGRHPAPIEQLRAAPHLAQGLETRPAIAAYLDQPRRHLWAALGGLDALIHRWVRWRLPAMLKRALRPLVRSLKRALLGVAYPDPVPNPFEHPAP